MIRTQQATIGDQLIAELGRRQALGFFFTYSDYQRLHAVASRDELRQFLDARGCQAVAADVPLTEIADAVLREPGRRQMASRWWRWRMLVTKPGFWLASMYVCRWSKNPRPFVALVLMFGPMVSSTVGLLVGWHFGAPLWGFFIGWYWLVAAAGMVRLAGQGVGPRIPSA